MSEPISNLSALIEKRVAENGFCVVTDHKLKLAFPSQPDIQKQAAEIQAFAKQQNLHVNISFLGICATFMPKSKKSGSSSGRGQSSRQKGESQSSPHNSKS